MVLCECICIITDAQRAGELGSLLVDDRIPIHHRVMRECTHDGQGVQAYAIDLGRLTDIALRAIRERFPIGDEMWYAHDAAEIERYQSCARRGGSVYERYLDDCVRRPVSFAEYVESAAGPAKVEQLRRTMRDELAA